MGVRIHFHCSAAIFPTFPVERFQMRRGNRRYALISWSRSIPTCLYSSCDEIARILDGFKFKYKVEVAIKWRRCRHSERREKFKCVCISRGITTVKRRGGDKANKRGRRGAGAQKGDEINQKSTAFRRGRNRVDLRRDCDVKI
jgi:hypothetical protein